MLPMPVKKKKVPEKNAPKNAPKDFKKDFLTLPHPLEAPLILYISISSYMKYFSCFYS